MNRRKFLSHVSATTLLSSISAAAPAKAAPANTYFTLAERHGRWWLITPEGRPFFSLGLNHIDSSPLRYPEAGNLWQEKYGNSTERWLKESVRPDLLAWGFNSVGWTQEVVIRGDTIHRHSPSFTYEEYQWLDLPYCHLLPFAETHQWDNEVRLPDFQSPDFAEWCDYVARSQCSRFADDPKLIGYFYTDCPLWVHTRPGNKWKGPLFDPQRLTTDSGRAELRKLATRYYQVTHAAIKRYDPHHLILGDRYEATAPLPLEVVESALPFVDVLCFQDFKEPIAHLDHWHRTTKKPVLWADGAKNQPATDPATGRQYIRNEGHWYADVLRGLRANPGCIGAHLCGAYLRNTARNRGLRDQRELPDQENLALITAAHRDTTAWVSSFK
jgi:hypothetical protein